MTQTSPRISGIDFDARGAQYGYFVVDHSNNEYDAEVIPVPIAVISGGAGQTVLLTAGTHGDEYEGQILLHELIREVTPDEVSGRLIILPALNLLAVRHGTRVSDVDGVNLNRSMPGNALGGPAQQTANIVSSDLLPLADFMIDIHSGGSKSTYVPSTFVYSGPSEAAWRKKVDAVTAMDLPYAIVVKPGLKSGSLSGAADAAGVSMISTELGGGATIDQQILARARSGLHSLLSSVGVLAGAPSQAAGVAPTTVTHTRWLALTDDSPVYSTVGGLFEPTVILGQSVEAGSPVGRVHFIEDLTRTPAEFFAPIAGVVAVIRHPTLVSVGSTLVNIASSMTGPFDSSQG